MRCTKTILRLIAPLGLALALAACGESGSGVIKAAPGGSTSSSSSSGGGSTSSSGGSSGSGAMVQGTSKDETLRSNVDGANIAITVHQPHNFDASAKYPLILHSHGFGGSRTNAAGRPANAATSLFSRLLDAGYVIISIDERGHGQSGGTIRVLDPDFEGKDLLQILDWAEENLPYLQYKNGNLVSGAIGGSYGGGYQHLIYAIDPKHRLDALAPEITWYDLRYSLAPGKVFKAYWGTLLSAAGNAAGDGGNMDPEVSQGLAQGLSTGQLAQAQLDLLYENSLVSYCEGNNPRGTLTKIDALYMQSTRDTLFNMNDAVGLYDCVKAQGGDVRFFTKINGHDGGAGEACGTMSKDNAIVAWFAEKLKGQTGAASYIPNVCFTLGETGTDGVVTAAIPRGGLEANVPMQSNFLAQEGNAQTLSIPLYTTEAGGRVLAGIPQATLTVASAAPSAPGGLPVTPGEPVLYFGLAVRRTGTTTDTLIMGNQWRPQRGTGAHEIDLNGVNVRLAAGDEVRLLIKGSEQARFPSMGAKVGAPVNISGTVRLPVLTNDLPAAPAQ